MTLFSLAKDFVHLNKISLLTDSVDGDIVDVCMAPLNRGICRAFIPRFYYNAGTNECESFMYGGCQGNDNNFRTENDCEKACVKLNG